MNKGGKYVKLVEWSDENASFIGGCQDPLYDGCHGPVADLSPLVTPSRRVLERTRFPLSS